MAHPEGTVRSMRKWVLVAALILVVYLFFPASCGGCGPGTCGLPERPQEAGGPPPMGHVVFQPFFLPFAFSVTDDGKISVMPDITLKKLVTPLGDFTVKGNVVTTSAGEPLRSEPADVTQVIICLKGSDGQRCQGYQIGTGRRVHIQLDGRIDQVVERNRITIEAAPGATVKIMDSGPPTKLEPYGPARIDVEEFNFQEVGNETSVDLERARSGTAADLSYNHITGELKPSNGAKVFLYAGPSGWTGPSKRSDYPGEQECLQKSSADWRDSFDKGNLGLEYSIYCIKTAEGDLGFLYIEPDFEQKPVAYYVYSFIWVR